MEYKTVKEISFEIIEDFGGWGTIALAVRKEQEASFGIGGYAKLSGGIGGGIFAHKPILPAASLSEGIGGGILARLRDVPTISLSGGIGGGI